MNAMVAYDHQTDSLWAHFTGEAIRGPFVGTRWEIVPALQTTWGRWKDLHPDTLVLDENLGYQFDPYETYYTGGWTAGGRLIRDDTLDPKEYVLGLLVNEGAKAYGFADMSDHPVVNDTVGGSDLVVTFDPESATGGVFSREVDGRTLTFSVLDSPDLTNPVMVDEETGTQWLLLTGEAIQGELKGTSLEQIPSNYSFWFAWKDWNPSTEVFLKD